MSPGKGECYISSLQRRLLDSSLRRHTTTSHNQSCCVQNSDHWRQDCTRQSTIFRQEKFRRPIQQCCDCKMGHVNSRQRLNPVHFFSVLSWAILISKAQIWHAPIHQRWRLATALGTSASKCGVRQTLLLFYTGFPFDLFLMTTMANEDRFAKFFHWQIRKETCLAPVLNYTATTSWVYVIAKPAHSPPVTTNHFTTDSSSDISTFHITRLQNYIWMW